MKLETKLILINSTLRQAHFGLRTTSRGLKISVKEPNEQSIILALIGLTGNTINIVYK